MKRTNGAVLAALSAAALTLLGASPADLPNTAQAPDRVPSLIGTWTCTTANAMLERRVYRLDGTDVTWTATGLLDAAGRYRSGRIRRDAKTGGWVAETYYHRARDVANAPGWTGAEWDMSGAEHIDMPFGPEVEPYTERFVHIDDDTFADDVAFAHGASTNRVCVRGEAPPPAALCPAKDVAPESVRAGRVDTVRGVAYAPGEARVLVTLDADSHVVSTRIVAAPSPDDGAVAEHAAMTAVYRTAYHDCHPVAGSYEFTVSFGS
jgi:hypothetical protein